METYSSEFLTRIEIFNFFKAQLQVSRGNFEEWNAKNRIEKIFIFQWDIFRIKIDKTAIGYMERRKRQTSLTETLKLLFFHLCMLMINMRNSSVFFICKWKFVIIFFIERSEETSFEAMDSGTGIFFCDNQALIVCTWIKYAYQITSFSLVLSIHFVYQIFFKSITSKETNPSKSS